MAVQFASLLEPLRSYAGGFNIETKWRSTSETTWGRRNTYKDGRKITISTVSPLMLPGRQKSTAFGVKIRNKA